MTPERPRVVNMFNRLREGDVDGALDIHWEPSPPAEGVTGLEVYFYNGILNAISDKYAHWWLGGNGGLLRQPIGRLYDYQKQAIRGRLQAMGLDVRDPRRSSTSAASTTRRAPHGTLRRVGPELSGCADASRVLGVGRDHQVRLTSRCQPDPA